MECTMQEIGITFEKNVFGIAFLVPEVFLNILTYKIS